MTGEDLHAMPAVSYGRNPRKVEPQQQPLLGVMYRRKKAGLTIRLSTAVTAGQINADRLIRGGMTQTEAS